MTTQIRSQTLAELAVTQLTGSRSFLLGLAETLEDSQLTTRVDGVGDHAISAVFTLAQHEFLHAGQWTTVRSSLGTKPLFG